MTDDIDPIDSENEPELTPARGKRRDGKPYAPNNTREDGSYVVGKGRAPQGHQFAVNDGRKRGKKEKGTKNLNTRWRNHLLRNHTINGKTQQAVDWVIYQTIARAIARSDRASETVLQHASRLEEADAQRKDLRLTDQELLDQWLLERLGQPDGAITDDDPSQSGGSDAENDGARS